MYSFYLVSTRTMAKNYAKVRGLMNKADATVTTVFVHTEY